MSDVYYHTGINYCGYTLEICRPGQQSKQPGYHYQIILSIRLISQEYHIPGLWCHYRQPQAGTLLTEKSFDLFDVLSPNDAEFLTYVPCHEINFYSARFHIKC